MENIKVGDFVLISLKNSCSVVPYVDRVESVGNGVAVTASLVTFDPETLKLSGLFYGGVVKPISKEEYDGLNTIANAYHKIEFMMNDFNINEISDPVAALDALIEWKRKFVFRERRHLSVR
jgi:hypothetical protein